jgi:CRISPR-associated endonuclease Cas2
MTKKELSFVQIMQKLHHSGIESSPSPNRENNELDTLPTINERIEKVIGIINKLDRPIGNMLFFVMYDIENNKVRTQIAKYLIKKGCTRVQRSIFLADLNPTVYEELRSDLTEVQAMYDNHDSILVVPVSTENIRSMKVIGQSIDIDIIMHTRNTLIF